MGVASLALLLLAVSVARGVSISGIVRDNSPFSIPVQYAMVNVSVGGSVSSVFTDTGGRYTVSVPSGSASVTIQHAAFVQQSFSATVPSTTVLSPSAFDARVAPMPFGVNGLRVTLEWGATPADLDLQAIGFCGTTFWSFRRRNPGGVPIRIDADIQNGFGPETITFGENLPCGVYSINVFVNGRSTNLPTGSAVVSVYQPDNPVPINTFVSNPPSNTKNWNPFDYVVTLVDPVTRQRQYQIIPKNNYNTITSPLARLPTCVQDIQWCGAAALPAPLLVVLAVWLAAL